MTRMLEEMTDGLFRSTSDFWGPQPPKPKGFSKSFYLVLTLVLGAYAAASGWVSTVHLEHEQEWSAGLLKQNMECLTLIGAQKKVMGQLLGQSNMLYEHILELEGEQ